MSDSLFESSNEYLLAVPHLHEPLALGRPRRLGARLIPIGVRLYAIPKRRGEADYATPLQLLHLLRGDLGLGRPVHAPHERLSHQR